MVRPADPIRPLTAADARNFRGNKCPAFRLCCPIGSIGAPSSSFRSWRSTSCSASCGNGVPKGPSLFIAYVFWLCSGFMGLHRFYLRNNWGFIFIPVFLLILHTTDVIRDKREDVSRTRAAVGAAVSELDHAKIPPGVDGDAADAGAPGQSRGRAARKPNRNSTEAQADLGALVQLFALAGDPDGRDAGRRRDPAAGAGAPAETARGRRAAQMRRPRPWCRTYRRSARTKIRHCASTRASPMPSSG